MLMLVMWGIQEKAFALLIEGKPEMQLICLIILEDTRIQEFQTRIVCPW